MGTFQNPQRRVDAFLHILQDILAHSFVVSACKVVRFTGLLASMSLALGSVVRLWMRSLYCDILHIVSWDTPFGLSADAQGEVLFWQKNFHNAG